MIFGAIGIGPENDAELRERAAFRETEIISFSENLLELGISEVVVVSTCNRSEVYFSACQRDDSIVALARDAYAHFFNIEDEKEKVFHLTGRWAVAHLFQVAAGLQSVIVGEDEILRQIKSAYDLARGFKNTGKYFNRLFQSAIKTAKEIKTETRISEIPLSTSHIAFQFLEREIEGFQGKKIMIVGMGEIGRLFYEYSVNLPFQQMYLVNRSGLKPEEAKGRRGVWLPYDQMRRYIGEMDIIIAATSSPHPILRVKDMPPLERPLFLLDMSIPRNIAPEIANLPGIRLYNIDAFKSIAEENRGLRRRLKEAAHGKIDAAVHEYLAWVEQSGCDGVIESLNQSVEDILADYLQYLFKKSNPAKETKIISRTFESALKRTMRNPILSLKAIEDPKTREIYSEITAQLLS